MYSNQKPAEWLRLMADLEHEGLGELTPIEEHGPLEPVRVGMFVVPGEKHLQARLVPIKRASSCDCCGELRICRPANHPSIETSACAECRGEPMCPICLDDENNCECPITMIYAVTP